MERQALSSALPTASQSTLGNMERRHQDWFDDNSADIRSLIHNKNAAHDALLRNQTYRTLHERFYSMRATGGWRTTGGRGLWLRYNINDAKNFYEAPKGVYGPSRFSCILSEVLMVS